MAPDWEEPAILLAEELGAGKVTAVATGGRTRAESVRLGLREVPDEVAVVLVHDGARPLVSEAVIDRVLAPLGEEWDGAVPALPVSDTLKRADGEQIGETVDREGLYAVQTPQAFVSSVLRAAIAGEAPGATDCSSFVQAAGGRVRLVPGDPRLVKVTTQADLELVAALLS